MNTTDRLSKALLVLLVVCSAGAMASLATSPLDAAADWAQMTSPPNGSVLPGPTVTFSWTAVPKATQYWLRVGITPEGGQIYNASQGLNRSATVSGIPTNGQAIYVRLSWRVRGWQRSFYYYTAANSPQPSPTPPPPPGGQTWVSGYYAGWFWPDYPPELVDVTAMTHFIFGRYAPGGGTLGGRPGDVVEGAGTGHQQSVEQYLVNKGHSVGVKALIMLGGVGDGPGFDASTVNPAIRATFINNILTRLAAKNYDGVDVDWEENLQTQAQQDQVIALLSELRTAAASHPHFQAPHAPILITWPAFWTTINWQTVTPWHVKIASLVDQYNLMTYGMAGAWPGWVSWHHSPLTDAQGSHPTSIEASIAEYAAAGIPKSKLGIGIGFYGLYYNNGPVSGPRQSLGNSGSQPNDVENGYARLLSDGAFNQPSGTRHWDAAAKQSYYSYSPAWRRYAQANTLIGYLSFEDEQSIAAKGQWVKANGVGGTIVWTINYGCTNKTNGDNPLLSAVKAAFR